MFMDKFTFIFSMYSDGRGTGELLVLTLHNIIMSRLPPVALVVHVMWCLISSCGV